MKTIISYTLLLFLCSSVGFAQPKQGKRDRIKALKIAFISDQLELTSEEAEKFWPIYNTFEDKKFELQHEKMKSYMNRIETDMGKLSENEAKNLLAQMEKTEDELHQLRKKFNQDVKSVLSAQKLVKLYKAEEQFRKNLLKQLRSNRAAIKN